VYVQGVSLKTGAALLIEAFELPDHQSRERILPNSIPIVQVLGLLTAFAGSPVSAAPHHGTPDNRPPAPHTFYDISPDPKSLELLALSDSGKVGSTATMDVIDVFKQPKMLVGNTWKFDCGKERMRIVHTSRVQPGSPRQEADIQPEAVSARASPKTFQIYQLACSGTGNLVERRTYHDDLVDIVKRFWAD
jgi:hypothetical protein